MSDVDTPCEAFESFVCGRTVDDAHALQRAIYEWSELCLGEHPLVGSNAGRTYKRIGY